MTISEKYYPNFFNDVYGPVMQAGSSSHTAAPCRIGYMAKSVLGEDVARIDVFLDKDGSFAGTFGVMQEDLGMLSGAYGLLPDDVRLFSIKQILDQEGIVYQFHFSVLKESKHINAMKFVLTGVSGKIISLVGNSVGGGMIEIVCVNGYPCATCGDAYVLLAEYDDKELPKEDQTILHSSLQGLLQYDVTQGESGKWLHCFYTSAENELSTLRNKLQAQNISVIRPVLPVVSNGKRKKQLFTTFTEWAKLCEEQKKSLSDIAIQYQMDASGWSEVEVVSYMRYIAEKMYGQTHDVFEKDAIVLETPFSGFHYAGWSKYIHTKETFLGPIMANAIKYAYAAITSVYGVQIVPGPMGTGGGILYSVLCAAKETGKYNDEDLLRGLFVAAGVGAIAYTRTNPTGEIIGCAGECGVCSAMAAAGVTQMRGGTPQEVEAAASMSLQATLGWPCDPIPGGDNQPCASRVVAAVVMAITFSDVALSGKTAVLPLHEVMDAADRIGRAMPQELRCTSKGGCCDTTTGQKCIKLFQAWRADEAVGAQ